MKIGDDMGPDGLRDGTLALRAYRLPEEARSEFWGFPNAAGMLSTQNSHSQTYGYWEAAFRINSLEKGMHLALWLMPADNSWPPEIDILEIVNNDPNGSDGQLGEWGSNVHGGGGGLQFDQVSDWQGWHKVGLEATPTSLRWFYDGVLVREEANFIHKSMYFLTTWEIGSRWSGAPDQDLTTPGEIEFDYVRAYQAKPGANEAGAPEGYALTWSDDFNQPSVGTDADDNFAPYFTGWGVRHLAGNGDQTIKVADDERAKSGTKTYGQALAETGLYGDDPSFHDYRTPADVPTLPVSPPPVATPFVPPSPPVAEVTEVAVTVSGDAAGSAGTGGPEARFVLLVDGVRTGSAATVTASHEEGLWQTISFDAGIDLSGAATIGVEFINDWANWKPGIGVIDGQDRNLYLDHIQFGDTTLQAEEGRFSYASGGGARGTQLLASNGTLNFELEMIVLEDPAA